MMKILLLEPYFTGSHKSWALGFQLQSHHQIEILSMKGQFWKWRMHGGAVTMANQFNESDLNPDLIMATDMLDFTTFLSLTRKKSSEIPTAIYFHENQLSYPWSPSDRDVQGNQKKHYGFINYTSAFASDHVLFNSKYHQDAFIFEVKKLLTNFPDHNELETVKQIEAKSTVLHLGLDLSRFDISRTTNNGPPLILWNHRWEYDKNPETFFKTLYRLDSDGIDFRLAVLGENFKTTPSIFDEAKIKLSDKIVHFGYSESSDDYAKWLWKADIIPVTNNQDFFGISIMEAVYCNTYPLLPDRLTYREFLPKKLHVNHIYKNEIDLYEKLKSAIANISEVRKLRFSLIAKKYDWSNMASIYDELFSSFIS